VTVTTVGYGDIVPQTVPGQIIASAMMILGYAIIAVPSGLIGVEMIRGNRQKQGRAEDISTQACPSCGKDGHESDAIHCKFCGHPL
jgi:voltage-gated potassium channel